MSGKAETVPEYAVLNCLVLLSLSSYSTLGDYQYAELSEWLLGTPDEQQDPAAAAPIMNTNLTKVH